MPEYIGAIDQGTTSSRFILFDRDGRIVHVDQREHEQINPKAGWVEHDANQIWTRTREVIGGALAASPAEAGDIQAVGITNQRETTVVWDRETAEPIHNAIVWQDTRTSDSSGSSPATRASTGCAGTSACRCRRTSRSQDPLAARQRRRRPGEGRRRPADVRQHGHLGAVEPHRRPRRRRARDRRHERQPHDADEPRDARLARAEPRADGDSALDAAGDPLLERDLRRGEGLGDRRRADQRHPRRPAGGAVRPDGFARATPRTRTGPARSCWSTPARRSSTPTRC